MFGLQLKMKCLSGALDVVRLLYKPLKSDEFRLRSIEPGTRWSHIHATVTTTTFADAPNYSAVSYPWGTESYNSEFFLNGYQVLIRHNLWLFLQYVRDSNTGTEAKTLWVDALCIRQSDAEEKMSQVCQLGKIFSNAHAVLAWIGEHDAYSRYIYGDSAELLRLARDKAWECGSRYLEQVSWKQFLLRSYWWRTWIVQELALCRDLVVCCGDDTISWEGIVLAAQDSGYATASWICEDLTAQLSISTQPNPYDSIGHIVNKLEQLDKVRERYQMQKLEASITPETSNKYCDDIWCIDELPHLMRICSQTLCLDPRDRVCSLLSIEYWATAFSMPIAPDYKLKAWELFVRVYLARACSTASENELFASDLIDALEVVPTLSLEFSLPDDPLNRFLMASLKRYRLLAR